MRVFIAILWVGLLAAGSPLSAEEVEKRFRLSLSAGGHTTLDEVRSDATNILSIVDDEGGVVNRFLDPRNDDVAVGTLELKGGGLASAALQYAVNRFFLVELSAGYQKTDLGDVEVQGGFGGNFGGGFQILRVPVGELERAPIELSAISRFRPQESFNPYIGAGVGYTIIGLEIDDAFDELSLRLDRAKGRQATATAENAGLTILTGPGEFVDLSGATVDARDTFTWHIVGGAEYSFARRWSVLLDFRYSQASRGITIGFNEGFDLGIAVPQATVREGSPEQFEQYGPMQLLDTGLIDFNGDGVYDPAFYYAHGGKISLDGFTFQFGVRHTF